MPRYPTQTNAMPQYAYTCMPCPFQNGTFVAAPLNELVVLAAVVVVVAVVADEESVDDAEAGSMMICTNNYQLFIADN